jgi:hypothetical protein
MQQNLLTTKHEDLAMRNSQDTTVLKVALLPAFILTAIVGAISILAVSIADTYEVSEARVGVVAGVARPAPVVASTLDARNLGAAQQVQAN